MMGITFAMLCFSTWHVGNDTFCIVQAYFDPSIFPNTDAFLTRLNTPCNLRKLISYALQTLLGDAFLVYRLYAVWQNIWITIPFILSTFSSGGVVLTATITAATSPDFSPFFIASYRRYPLTFSALTLVTNSMCTLLIAGKIYWTQRKTSGLGRAGGQSLVTPMILIIESGAIYSTCLLIQISLYASGSFAIVMVLDSLPSIIGITFSLVIVRLGLGLSAYGPGASTYAGGSSLISTFTSAPQNSRGQRSHQLSNSGQVCQCGRGMSLRPLEVRITRKSSTTGDASGADSFMAHDTDDAPHHRHDLKTQDSHV